MSDLISRDEAIERVLGTGYADQIKDNMIFILRRLPTIEERKKGEWLDNKWLGEKCSVCSWELHYINFGQFKYCPNCGARMKGE